MSDVVVCTVITKSHLACARTLARTLAAHDPGARLHVLLADRVDDRFDPALEPFHLIRLEDLADQDAIARMSFYYSPFELCCALRGLLHQHMLEQTTAAAWMFLDSDVMICDSLAPLFEELSSASILLNPHSTAPYDIEQVEPNGINLLRSGLYNGGFLGVRRSGEARRFVEWFKSRLERYCFDDRSVPHARGLFVDQLWLNLAPVYFSDVALCVHPGANVSHWNLLQRRFAREPGGRITVNGRPLLFVHFSGWDFSNPALVSRYSPSLNAAAPPLWVELAMAYRDELLANGHESTMRFPYAFATFDNQEPITARHRRQYYSDLAAGAACAGSPFAAHRRFAPGDDGAPTRLRGWATRRLRRFFS